MRARRNSRRSFAAGAVAAAVALAILISGFSPAAASSETSADIVLADFETADGLDGVTFPAPELDSATITDEFASAGTSSMRFDTGGFENAEGRVFPRVWLNVGSTVPDVDWTQKRLLHIGAANGSIEHAQMYVVIWDTAGHFFQRSVAADPFEYRVFQFQTSAIAAAGVDLGNLDKIQISTERSVNPKTLFVDDIRLTDEAADVPSEIEAAAPALIRLMGLPQALTSAEAAVDEQRARIRPVSFEPEQALRAQADAIDAQLDEYAGRIPDLGTELGNAREIWFGIHDLDWTIRRLSGLIDARAASPSSAVGLGFADSMSRVYPRDLPCDCDYGRTAKLDMIRGEHEGIQLVTVPYGRALTNASVRASITAGPSQSLTVKASPVVSLNITAPVAQRPGRPTDFRPSIYEGWTPDPIQTAQASVDVGNGDLQAFWVDLETSRDAAPGSYEIDLAVAADGVPAQHTTLTVRVRDAVIDAEPQLRTAVGHDPAAYAEPYGVTDPADVAELVEQEYAFLGDYKLQGDNIYRSVYESGPPSVERLRRIEEEYGGLRQFNVWYFDPRLFDLTAPETWDAQADELFDFIQSYVDEYRAAGFLDKAYLYCCDETRAEHTELVKHVLTRFKQRFPEIEVLTTAIDNDMGRASGLGELIDWWVRDVPWFDKEIIDERHAAGQEAWWYLHAGNRNPTPNVFVNYDPGPLRTLLGPMIHQADLDGFLYYRVDRWYGHGVLDDGPLSSWEPRTWNNYAGDGALLYPGPDGPIPSIRLENMRDGLEDYNLLESLRHGIQAAPPTTDPELLAKARHLLGATDVVTDNYSYATDPAEYRAWRTNVAKTVAELT